MASPLSEEAAFGATQGTQYRWYANTNAVQPTSALAAQNSVASIPNASTIARLRTNLGVTGSNLTASSQAFKLQYGNSTGGPWSNVGGDWWNSSWGSRRKISLNNAASAENLVNFPIRVSLNSSNIDYAKTQNSGQDIRFVDGDGTLLKHEIEVWNESGSSEVWVKVPQIDAGSTSDFVYVYYNNAAAADGQDAANVWNSDYRAVWHMNGTNGSATLPDSATTGGVESATKKTGTSAGGPANFAAGKVGGAQDFNKASTQYAQTTGLLGNAANITVSGWFDLDVKDSFSADFINLGDVLAIRLDQSGNKACFFYYYNSSSSNELCPTATYAGTGWHYVTYTIDDVNNTHRAYVDGVLLASATVSQSIVWSGRGSNTQFGRHGLTLTDPRFFDGRMDEMRFSTSARSVAWANAEYRSTNNTMNSFGSEEAYFLPEWNFYNNATPADGATITARLLTSSNVNGSYIESATTPVNPNTIPVGSFGEWDFSLDPANAVANTTYFFRMVKADGSPLDSYSTYPQLDFMKPVLDQAQYRWYANTNAVQPTTALASQNTAGSLNSLSPQARLRTNIGVTNAAMTASSQAFSLEYGTSTSGPWTGVGSSGGWWNSSWASRKRITFDNSASSTNLINFPVRVSLSSANIDYAKTQNSGQDLRFIDGDGTVLKYEIETWNESGTSEVWVKIPQLDAASTTDYVFMYYNNAAAPAGQDGDNVWDTKFKGVYHLKQDPSVAGTGGILDSTSNNNDGTDGGSMNSADLVSGKINGAFDFDGSDDYVTIPYSATQAPTVLTLSEWVNFDSIAQGDRSTFSKMNTGGYGFGEDASATKYDFQVTVGGTVYNAQVNISSLTTGAWHHLVGTYDGETMYFYVNGVLAATNTTPSGNISYSSSNSLIIGGDGSGSTVPDAGSFFDGKIDESRIYNAPQTADWVLADYKSGMNTLNTIASEEPYALPAWGYNNNATPVDGATISARLLTSSNVNGSYIESATTPVNPNAIAAGSFGEWDFSLDGTNAALDTNYYFRIVKADGTPLNSYTTYPVLQISSNGPPNAPTSLAQTKTGGTGIVTGAWTDEASVRFTANLSDTDNPDTVYLCVEVKAIGVAFTNTENSCGSSAAYGGTAVTATHTIASLTNGTQYHWQARARDADGLYSSWVQYGGNADPNGVDFGIDTSAPSAGTVRDGITQGADVNYNDGSLSALSGNWSGFADASSGIDHYDYSIGVTAGGTTIAGWTTVASSVTEINRTGLTLQTNTLYYFNVRAVDALGQTSSVVSSNGQVVAPTLTFTVSSNLITFDRLNAANSYTSSKTLNVTTSTNAYSGYTVKQFSDTQLSGPGGTIGAYAGTSTTPTVWTGTGFGYTTSDTDVQGAGNKFGSGTRYAGLVMSKPGDVVADNPGPITATPIVGQVFTLTYRVTAPVNQASGSYVTPIHLGATANF